MNRYRPAFAFKIAVGVIIILGISIIALIFMLNTITHGNNPYMISQPAPLLEESTEVAGETTSSYLDVLEHYTEVDMDEFSQDQAKEESSASLVSQHSEASKNSISSRIDAIVSKALHN